MSSAKQSSDAAQGARDRGERARGSEVAGRDGSNGGGGVDGIDLGRIGNRALISLSRSGQLKRNAVTGAADGPREYAADAPATGDHTGLASRDRSVRDHAHGRGAAAATLDAAAVPNQEQPLIGAIGLSGGILLDQATRADMEARFGEPFGDVRVHADQRASAAAEFLHSRAFTVGRDIAFANGQYAPTTTEGRRLLAHELAHVVQQSRPSPSATAGADHHHAEQDARDAAGALVGGSAPSVRASAAPGSVQADGGHAIEAHTNDHLGPGLISVEHMLLVEVYSNAGGAPDIRGVSGWEWGESNEHLRITVSVRGQATATVVDRGRWQTVEAVVQKTPSFEPDLPKPPKPKPDPAKPAPPPPKPAPPPKNKDEPEIPPPPGMIPEVVIGPDDPDAVPPAPAPDKRPLDEQVLTALKDDPSKAARLAPKLTDAEMEQFDAKDRASLLGALASQPGQPPDIETVLRILRTTPPSQQAALLDKLVADDGKVLAALRASVQPSDRDALEGALFQLQLGVNLTAGSLGASPNLFDPLGARGFRPLVWSGRERPAWARDLQARRAPNGDTILQAPGQNPIVIEGLLARVERAERQNESIASREARGLSTPGKVDRIKELAENAWTGSDDEERIINILRYTSASEAPMLLKGLKDARTGNKPLLDKLDDVVDLDNNVELHAQLSALRMRARQDDPKLLDDIAKAPVLPWHDTLVHNRAVFSVRRMSDGRIAVTYGALQSFDLEASKDFGAAMRALPKEMRGGGTLFLNPDDIVIVNDLDGNRQVPLTAADLVAFEHSGDRGMLKHMANLASMVVPVGLAARGTISVGRAALEVALAAATMTADEYRLEITKSHPGLMAAIDIASLALAMKGGVDLTKAGAAGLGAAYVRLKKEYEAFKTLRAAKALAAGSAASNAAKIADAEAALLLRRMEQANNGQGSSPLLLGPGDPPYITPPEFQLGPGGGGSKPPLLLGQGDPPYITPPEFQLGPGAGGSKPPLLLGQGDPPYITPPERRLSWKGARDLKDISTMLEEGVDNAGRNRLISALRDVHGAPPPEYPGYIPQGVLGKNVEAIQAAQKTIHDIAPDRIIAIERGGSFLGETVVAKDAALAQKLKVLPKTDPVGKFKFDADALQAAFEQDILAGKRKFVIVDAYMGGKTAEHLRDGVLKPLSKKYPGVTFDVVWMRETIGFEQTVAGGGSVLKPPKGEVPAGSPFAGKIRSHYVPVQLVLGDDMNVVLDATAGSSQPLRIFNRRGEIVRVLEPGPGETTRDLLRRLMSGQD